MKIKIAKHIGFCFGVRRAVDIAHQTLDKDGRFFCLGPLIHNPQEVKRLSEKGLAIVDNINGLKRDDTFIIRSHGLLPDLIESVKKSGARPVDATCPFVKKAQNICKTLSEEGFDIIVMGDRHHPEVKSIVGFANGKAAVVESMKDLKQLKLNSKKVGVVAQTTQSKNDFHKLVKALLEKYNGKCGFDELRVFDTICGDSSARQLNARKISAACDAIVVIGGKNSANTRRLVKICKEKITRTYHVETNDDIEPKWFRGVKCVGVVSGASTPDWIIQDVVKNLSRIRRIKK